MGSHHTFQQPNGGYCYLPIGGFCRKLETPIHQISKGQECKINHNIIFHSFLFLMDL